MRIPSLKKPTLAEVQKTWLHIKSIESDNSTEEPVEFEFISVLKKDENYIKGFEYETRLKTRSDIKLGFQHAQWIAEHQDEIPELKELREKRVWYIDFPALVVVYADGGRYVPCLHNDGGRFVIDWYGLALGFHDCGRVAVSSKQDYRELGTLEPLGTGALESLERIAIALERLADKYAPRKK